MTRVLLVDDDPHLRLALSKALTRKGQDVVDVANGEAALPVLQSGQWSDGGRVDVCVLDLRMPGLSGIDVLRRTLDRRVPVVVLTGDGTVPDAVLAMRLGAVNFVQKPVDADELLPILQQAIHTDAHDVKSGTILGASEALLSFLSRLDKAASSSEPVLLTGETGTGKELCAKRLHELSPRAQAPFASFNAAATVRDSAGHSSADAELFGTKNSAGLVHKAADGTLFINQVGELSVDTQSKLLRAIDEQRCRVVAATHRDVKALVAQGRFRADLLYRLSTVPLHAPALRERDDDVILIARAWLARAVIERPAGRAKDVTLTFSDDAEDALRAYPWPGNVRELINVVKRAALFTSGDVVEAELIKELQADSPFSHAEDAPLVQGAPAAGDGPRAGQRVTLEELEKTHIRRLLDELHNVSEVSRIVGIDRRTLQRKMIAWGFRDPKPSDSGEG